MPAASFRAPSSQNSSQEAQATRSQTHRNAVFDAVEHRVLVLDFAL